jgi:hypothetical protein
MPKKRSDISVLSSQDGEALLTVLFAVALVLVAVMIFQATSIGSFFTMKLARGRQSFEQVNSFLSQTILTQMRARIEGLAEPRSASCPNLSAGFLAAWPVVSPTLGVKIDIIRAGGDVTADASYSGNGEQQAARTRCKTLQTANLNAFGASSTGLYACLLLTSSDPTPNRASIFANGPVFAEVSYAFRDGNDKPVTCEAYRALGLPVRGVAAFYSVYWRTQVASNFSYLTHSSWLFAPASPPW